MTRLYTQAAAWLVRTLVAWCLPRGRYVDYVHAGRPYMRRYVLCGYRTGDPPQTGWRAWLPNLYLHHMSAPDADPSLHDHPWPWAVSWIVLGGYREEKLKYPFTPPYDARALYQVRDLPHWVTYRNHIGAYWRRAPALNVLRGDTFHRIAQLHKWCPRPFEHIAGPACPPVAGVYTLFLAGPRRHTKGWGYLVAGRGYVPQKERHAEMDATVRGPT